MVKVSVQQQVQASRKQVLGELLDHANLSRFFNAKFRQVRKQNEGSITGGQGTQRQVSMLGTSFVEEILSADESGISYQIIGDWPVKQHRGTITLIAGQGDETLVNYQIVCQSPWFLPSALLQCLLNKDMLTPWPS